MHLRSPNTSMTTLKNYADVECSEKKNKEKLNVINSKTKMQIRFPIHLFLRTMHFKTFQITLKYSQAFSLI